MPAHSQDRTDRCVEARGWQWSGAWQTLRMASQELQWFGRSQPQTLQGAVLLCYLNAALALFALMFGGGLSLLLLAEAVAGVAIANDRRWGYWLGVALAGAYLALQVLGFVVFTFNLGVILNLAFAIILVALLLHPQSREYQKVWFH